MAKGSKSSGNRNGKTGRSSRVSKALHIISQREPYGVVVAYSTVPTTSGAIANLTQIPQGDSLNTRAGDKVLVEKINVRCNILATATSNWRYIVFRDRFNTGTTPVVGDVLANPTVASPYSTINVIQQKRFTILMDKVMSFSSAGSLSGTFKRILNVNQPTYYSGSSATVNQAAGQIYLLVVSDVATAGAHAFEAQTIYHDF